MRLVVVVVVVDDDDVVVVMMRLALFYLGLGKFESMAGQAQLVIYQSSKGEFAKNTRKSKERCAHISVELCFVLSMPTCYTVYTIFKIENLVGFVWTFGSFSFLY